MAKSKPTKNGEQKRLYLIDAMALAYRAHFIFINRPLINSRGVNTSATYGFTSALLKLIEEHGIQHMAVVFDVMEEGGTFRDELYDEYKANREPTPEDLIENLPYIKEVVEAFDIPVIEMGGVEADDVIGTLATKCEDEGAEVVIVSPDKDFQQLLSDRVTMFRPAYRGEEFDPVTVDSFRERYGVEPSQFVDILALMGDSSDNVPGVPGIGEKTAMKLIQQYGNVEALLKHVDEVKGKRAREGLEGHADDAVLSKELVTIKTDLDVDVDWELLHRAHPDLRAIEEVFDHLEFATLLQRARKILGLVRTANGDAGKQQVDLFTAGDGAKEEEAGVVSIRDDLDRHDETTVSYRLVTNRAVLEEAVGAFNGAVDLSIELRTTSQDRMLAAPVGIALAASAGDAYYIPVPLPDGTSEADVLAALSPVFESNAVKVGHDLKYAIVVLSRYGLDVQGPLFDTRIAHYLLAPDQPHDIAPLAKTYLGYRLIPKEDVLGTGRSKLSDRDVEAGEMAPFACERADLILRLRESLFAKLEESNLLPIAEEVEFPLMRVLAAIEKRGIRVDPKILSKISEKMESDIESLAGQIFESAGEEFNIGSPSQLAEILFEKMDLPVISKTSTGKASTRESVLKELALHHDLPALILDWRELAKLKSTYVDALPALINPETGRVHTHFNQTVAATGRLSSQNPNLQNIPIRSARGREIRRAFVPAEGFRLMSADYVQIELRILASMSGDRALAEAFESGQDIHTATAARVFKIKPEAVTRRQRSRAKEVNYGIPYGISAFGLAQRLRCPRAEAQELIDLYQRSYPEVTRFLSEQVQKARECGYAETLLGRRRFVPAINARNRNERAAAERIAVNMPIQGSQADMIKIAMLRIEEELEKRSLRSAMLLQVHDELVFEIWPSEADEVTTLVKETMISALPLQVPIEVDLHIADNWLDAH